jgi:hypothetical protein
MNKASVAFLAWGIVSTQAAWAQVDLVPKILGFRITNESFSSGSGDVIDGCIAPGTYKLLRFESRAQNLGVTDLHIGPPEENLDLFVWSESHGHYHFENFLTYTLFDWNGEQVRPGFKQAFCLMDSASVVPGAPSSGYDCHDQGISAGWTDIYSSGLPCQFIDITGLPDAKYTLRLDCNDEQKIVEGDYTNNSTIARLKINADKVSIVPEPTPAPNPGDLLSQGKPATASSIKAAGYAARYAVDGNTATRWAAGGGSADPWLKVDLGARKSITRVKIVWPSAFAAAYKFQVSNNGTSWTTILNVTGGDGGIDDHNVATSGRYARLVMTKRATALGYAVSEFKVFGGKLAP